MSTVRFRYRTYEFGSVDIHVRALRDNQQFADNQGAAEKLGISSASWPLFGIIWPAGHILAKVMSDYPVAGKRILEVGCGLGLTSLLLNQRAADITATDYHPEAGRYLAKNVQLNDGKPIPFIRTGWADSPTELGRFDLIVGSDLLYEADHARLLSEFIDQHAQTDCEVVMVDPGRGHHARFSKMMVALGFSHRQHPPVDTDFLEAPFKGQVLHYTRRNGADDRRDG